MCLLGLLGAQCVNKHQDYDSGIKYWKQALKHLEALSKVRVKEINEINRTMQIYICFLKGSLNKKCFHCPEM